MINKFTQSWELFKTSVRVTVQYPKLLWFPMVTILCTSLIALVFLSAVALPLVLHHTGYALTQKEHWLALNKYYFSSPSSGLDSTLTKHYIESATSGAEPEFHQLATKIPWVVTPAIYLVSMFLATFFNTAFYSEIIAAFNGKGVSLRRGFRSAANRLPSILAWSLLAGIVGWLIRTIEERLPLGGRIVTGLIGIAWSVAAVFAIPVIVHEQPTRNPLNILRQSAFTLKRTWGESLIGYIGFSAGSLAIFGVSLLVLLVFGALAIGLKSVILGIIGVALWILFLLTMGYISSVATHVFRCALYIYASEGVVPAPYTPELLNMAWKVKKTS